MQKLAAFPEVETKIFDLEKPFAEQDFEPGSFDLIVGTNVLHAVADVRAALRNLHELLTPGGSLVFMDLATPQLWTEAVFGLTSGWWRFTDRDLRSTHPLLARSKWEELLRETGFGETASIPGLMGRYGEGQITLFARKIEDASVPVESIVQVPSEKSWLVFADNGGIGDAVAARLRASGASCKTVRRGTAFTAPNVDTFTVRPETLEDWQQLFQTYSAGPALERIVYLWNLDLEFDDEADFGTDA